jgi:predicted RecB family nuclease
VSRNKLHRDDKLLLALDARVLSEVHRRGVSLGKIMYGENYATLKVKTSASATEVRKLTDKIGTLLASPSPPDLVLNRHCGECEFESRCRQKAIEKDALSLLAGMTEKERTNFNSKLHDYPTLPHLPTTPQATRTKGQEREVPPLIEGACNPGEENPYRWQPRNEDRRQK